MTVFLVRRFSNISPSWNEYPGKTFEEVCAIAADKIRDGNATTCYEVVEMAGTRRAIVAAEITSVEVTEELTP